MSVPYSARDFFKLVRHNYAGRPLHPQPQAIWVKSAELAGRQVASGSVAYHATLQDYDYRVACHEAASRLRGEKEPGPVPTPNEAHRMWFEAGGLEAREGHPDEVTPEMWEATKRALKEMK